MGVLFQLVEWEISRNVCKFCDGNELWWVELWINYGNYCLKSTKMLTGVSTTQTILLRLILGTKIVVGSRCALTKGWSLDLKHAHDHELFCTSFLSSLFFPAWLGPLFYSETFLKWVSNDSKTMYISELHVLWLLTRYRREAHLERAVY